MTETVSKMDEESVAKRVKTRMDTSFGRYLSEQGVTRSEVRSRLTESQYNGNRGNKSTG